MPLAGLVEPVGLVEDVERFAQLRLGDFPGVDVEAGEEGPVEDGPDRLMEIAKELGLLPTEH